MTFSRDTIGKFEFIQWQEVIEKKVLKVLNTSNAAAGLQIDCHGQILPFPPIVLVDVGRASETWAGHPVIDTKSEIS